MNLATSGKMEASMFAFLWYLLLLNGIKAGKHWKCCPLDYELSRNFSCGPSTSSTVLLSSSPNELLIRKPRCNETAYELTDLFVSSYCVDKVSGGGDAISGLKCADSAVSKDLGKAPAVHSLRKCCPRNRKYDSHREFCWSEFSPDYAAAVADVLKLSLKGKSAFVDVSFGPPPCKINQALVDYILDYNDVLVADTNALVSKIGNFTSEEFCVDVIDDVFEKLVVRTCGEMTKVCKERSCVRKCCPSQQALGENRTCVPTNDTMTIALSDVSTGKATPVLGVKPTFLQGSVCKHGKYALKPEDENENHLITIEGYVVMLATNSVINHGGYCVETVNFNPYDGTYTFLCFPPPQDNYYENLKSKITLIGSICSVVFLSLTFMVYSCLPTLQNLHGKALMCYTITLVFGYSALSVIYFNNYITQEAPLLCKIFGYSILFSFLSSFCWLNVICYDIWSTFGNVKSGFYKRSSEPRRILLYSVYGWGLPILWTSFAALCQFTSLMEGKSPIWKPDISEISCWFNDKGSSKMIFFVLPCCLMLLFNSVLFILTVRYCSKVRTELLDLQKNDVTAKKKFLADKQKFMMNVKLFVVMGINWALEMMSLTVQVENRHIFFISDVVNAILGVLIFAIFILKSRVMRELKRKMSKRRSDAGAASNTCTSTISYHTSPTNNSNPKFRFSIDKY